MAVYLSLFRIKKGIMKRPKYRFNFPIDQVAFIVFLAIVPEPAFPKLVHSQRPKQKCCKSGVTILKNKC